MAEQISKFLSYPTLPTAVCLARFIIRGKYNFENIRKILNDKEPKSINSNSSRKDKKRY